MYDIKQNLKSIKRFEDTNNTEIKQLIEYLENRYNELFPLRPLKKRFGACAIVQVPNIEDVNTKVEFNLPKTVKLFKGDVLILVGPVGRRNKFIVAEVGYIKKDGAGCAIGFRKDEFQSGIYVYAKDSMLNILNSFCADKSTLIKYF